MYQQANRVNYLRIGGIRGFENDPEQYSQLLRDAGVVFTSMISLGSGYIVIGNMRGNPTGFSIQEVLRLLQSHIPRPCYPSVRQFYDHQLSSVVDLWVRIILFLFLARF